MLGAAHTKAMTVTNARSVFNFNCKFVEPDNDHNHRVAASDVDFRFDPDGNSGALYCYAKMTKYLRDQP